MKREYPDHPLIGVAAVVFDGNAVWLARRNQAPGQGRWSLPGGLVELGEGHMAALHRELKEELSITIQVGGLVGVFDKIFLDHQAWVQYHYVVVDYWGWITEGGPTPASDISEILRVPLDRLNSLNLDETLIRTIQTAQKARHARTPEPLNLPPSQRA